MRAWLLATVVAMTIGMPTGPAAAQEYCVACREPEATYRCTIDHAQPQGVPLKLLCIATMARDGGHASCSVKGGTVFDCVGPIRRVDARTAGDVLARGEKAASGSQQVPASTPAGTAEPDRKPPAQSEKVETAEPPKTVAELAKSMTKSSAQSLGKAGDALSGTTRKAWNCLVSLFSAC